MNTTAIRHGQTEGNIAQIVQSHSPGVLTDEGIEQAHEVGRSLAGMHFDKVYCSDLQRAVDTADIITSHLDGVKAIQTPDLRERSLGELDGSPYAAIPPELLLAKDLALHAKGGESWLDVEVRLVRILNSIFEENPDGNILIVSHGWTLRLVRSMLTDMSLSESLLLPIDNATPQNWSMSRLLS